MRHHHKRGRRKDESGYVLLLVLLMAAVIAISLYKEIPRVAFDAQREKEQLLIDRANEYKRSIQMFMKTNNRYPTKIEDLESFNNRRFLRKRFTDPMTGKDEWRFIHIVNGVLVDSVLFKAQKGAQAAAAQSSLVGEIPVSTGDAMPGSAAAQNLALRRRASDGSNPGIGGDGTTPPVDPNNPNPQNPNGQPYPGAPVIPGQQPLPGQQFPGQQVPGQVYAGSQYPGQVNPGQQQQYPGQQQIPGQVAPYPGQPVNSQIGGVSPTYPYPTTPGANGTTPPFAQPGMNPGQNNTASQMIQQILTSPRPGGMPGQMDPSQMGAMQGAPGAGSGFGQPGAMGAAGAGAMGSSFGQPVSAMAGAGPGQAVGQGIAGIASTADQEGIKVINDRTNYKEWEFIFDPRRVPALPNPLTGSPGTSAASMGTGMGAPIGTPIGTPATNAGTVPVDPFMGTGGVNAPPPGFGPVQGGNGGPVVVK